jgi:hypothetical protein
MPLVISNNWQQILPVEKVIDAEHSRISLRLIDEALKTERGYARYFEEVIKHLLQEAIELYKTFRDLASRTRCGLFSPVGD